MGAGAVGGALGACLAASGHDVCLIARGQHYETIATQGLRFETPDGPETLEIPVVDDPKRAKLRSGDVVVLAVKSQDTDAALQSLVDCAPDSIALICAQNGVENERRALRRFPRVYGAIVLVPATYLTPGTIGVNAGPPIGICDVGRYPRGIDDTALEVAEAISSSRWASSAMPSIMDWKYAKLLDNLTNAIQIVVGLGIRDSELGRLLRSEGVACLAHAGIDVVSDAEVTARRNAAHVGRRSGPALQTGASTWQSIARGTGSIETAYLNGEISFLGRLSGMATPANDLLGALAEEVVSGRRAAGSWTEQELLARLAG